VLEAWRGIAQARSDGGACLDGARCPRYAGRFVANELGFDACVDHRASDFANGSKPLVPRGLTPISRTSAAPCSRRCSRYSTILRAIPYAGSSRSTTRRSRCPGPTCFRCCANASSCVGSWSQISPRNKPSSCTTSASGCARVPSKYREDIVEGLENAPASFLGMLQGKNFGKTW
jgi:NADPH-dependent curcumin reductase